MLTVFRNDTLVKNEIISNYIRVYSSFLISSLGIFLIRSAASKLYFSEHSFCVRGFGSFEIYFQHSSAWNRLCPLLAKNLVLFQTTYEPLIIHEL